MIKKDKQDIVIIGAGDFGKEVAWLIERINHEEETWNLLGYVDEDRKLYGSNIYGYPVLGGLDWLCNLNEKIFAVCAIGNCNAKEKISTVLNASSQVEFTTLTDPSVAIANSVDIGKGSILCAGVVITPDAKIGRHVIINLNSTIGHDTVIGDFCTIHPGSNISGKVELGERVFVGTGTKILQSTHICGDCILGAGAVVTEAICDKGTYVGIPAKRKKV